MTEEEMDTIRKHLGQPEDVRIALVDALPVSQQYPALKNLLDIDQRWVLGDHLVHAIRYAGTHVLIMSRQMAHEILAMHYTPRRSAYWTPEDGAAINEMMDALEIPGVKYRS